MPQATHHFDVSGWPMERGRGCGAQFIDTAADNGAITDWHLGQVRPDLPICNND